MLKKNLNVAVLYITLFFISSCESTPSAQLNNDEEKHIIPSTQELLEKTRKVIDPNGEMNNIKTLQINMKQTELNHAAYARAGTVYKFIYQKENPEIYNLCIKTMKSKVDKKIIQTIDTYIRNDKVTLTLDGKVLENPDSSEKSFINKQVERTEEFKSILTLGLFEPQLHEKVSNTIYTIHGFECYNLKIILANRFIDNSDKLSLYIDCHNFHIRMIETDFFTISSIVYKKFNNFNFIHKCKFDDNFDDDVARYYVVEKFDINKPIADKIFNRKLFEGKSL